MSPLTTEGTYGYLMYSLPQTPDFHLLQGKQLPGPHPRAAVRTTPPLSTPTHSLLSSSPKATCGTNLDRAPSPLLTTLPPAAPSTGHPTPAHPGARCTPTSVLLTPTLPPQDGSCQKLEAGIMPSLVPSFPHVSHAPPDSVTPLPCSPSSPPAGRVVTWGPLHWRDSVVSGLTHGDEVASF